MMTIVMVNCIVFCCRSGEAIRGYDFVVNSVWPEVVSSIEAKTSSIFAPGNPDIFQAVCRLSKLLNVCLSLINKTVYALEKF